MTIIRNLLLTSSLIGLAACGGGGGGTVDDNAIDKITIDPPEEANRVFSTDAGDAGQALSDGQTLTARQVAMAGINLNYNSGDTAITDTSEFTVRLNGEGEVTLVLEGTETVFTPDHRDPDDDGTVYGYFTRDDCDAGVRCVSLFSYTGEIDELKSNGHGFMEILNAQSNQISEDGQPDLRAFAVVGTETQDADLGSLGNATYSGWTRFDVYPESGFVDSSESRTRLRSDLTMTADFGDGTVSGLLNNFEARDPGEAEYTGLLGTVTMTEAEFDVNGFKGGLVADAAFASDTGVTLDTSSAYSGAFYGPNAEEVGGVFSISGSDDDGAFNGIGFFAGNQ